MIRSRARTWIVTAALATGAAVGAAGVANAAGGSSSGSTGGATARPAMVNPATISHGPGETLLTGTAAAKAKAAALAAVPGATVVRVETDSAGAAYEAHLRKADGSYVTVKMNSSFTVTATEPGFGSGPGAPPTTP